MSKETLQHGPADHGDFEREDLSPQAVFAFLAGLAVVCVVSYFILLAMYGYLERYQATHQPPQNPLVAKPRTDTRVVTPEDIKTFREPRLETDERGQLNRIRLEEEKVLNSYGWVDEKAGVARIPIERAMALVAERGLPTRAQQDQGLVRNANNSADAQGAKKKAGQASAAKQ